MDLNHPEATEAALSILRSGEPFQWYAVTLFALALYVYVNEITKGRINIGAGTMYGNLSRMENEGLITPVAEEDRKKIYELSEKGKIVLKLELERLQELLNHGKSEMGDS